MIKTVIFDMDGTLIDTEIIWHQAWQKANREYGLGLDEATMRSFIGMPKQTFDLILPKLLPQGIDMGPIRKMRTDYYEWYKKEYGIQVKEGVFKLLDYLKSKKFRLAICTSTFAHLTFPVLKQTGLYDYFEVIVTGDEITNGKPDPEIYLKTLQLLGEKAENCIAVEDTAFGIKSACAAHIRTYYVKDINDIDSETEALVCKRLNTIDEIIGEIGG